MLFIKKNTAKLTLFLLTVFASTNAHEPQYPIYDNCCQPGSCYNWFSWDGFSFKAEGLYWNVEEDNLAYVRERSQTTITEVVSPTLSNIIATADDKTIELNPNWTGGYRLGLGYNIPCTCWDIDLIYTYVRNKHCASKNAPNDTVITTSGTTTTRTNTFLSSIYPGIAVGASLNRADATWKLDFNTLDLLLGRHFHFCNCIDFHPFAGLRYVDIQQKFRIATRSLDDLSLTTNTFGTARNKMKTNFWGVGIQGGFDLDLQYRCGFSLYSQLAGGIVYGKEHDHSKRRLDATTRVGASRIFTHQDFDFKDHDEVARFNIDLALGVEWACRIDGYSLLTFNLGWEYHQFFDQNFFRATENNDLRGDLSFHGVTFGANYQF